LNLVWDKLLPALKSAPLATDDEAREKLEHTLKGLSLRPLEGSSSASPAKVSDKKYVFATNARKLESITLVTDDKGDTLIARVDGVDQRLSCGRGEWRKGRFALGVLHEQPVATSGAWTGDDSFAAKICFYETPFILKLTLKFSGDQLLLDSESNVGFGSTKQAQLEGKAE
jgi:hypothetical protein